MFKAFEMSSSSGFYPLCRTVNDPVMMIFQSLSCFLDRLQPTVGGPEVQFFPVSFRPGGAFIAPK